MSKAKQPPQDGNGVDPQDLPPTTGEGSSTALAAMLKKRRQRVEHDSEPMPLDSPDHTARQNSQT
jgi:hypothetical protein